MLEGLDVIDWATLKGPSVALSAAIPANVRALLSSDANVREQAREALFSEYRDELYDTTPHIIPFVIEILALAPTEIQQELLEELEEVSFQLPQYASTPQLRIGIRAVGLAYRTYIAVEGGIDLYIRFAQAPEQRTRRLAIGVLGNLTDSAPRILPFLMERFQQDKDFGIQMTIVKAMGYQLQYLSGEFHQLYLDSARFLLGVVDDTRLQRDVRIQAADHLLLSDRDIGLARKHLDLTSAGVILREEYLRQSITQRYKVGLYPLLIAHADLKLLLPLLSDSSLSSSDVHEVVKVALETMFNQEYRVRIHALYFQKSDEIIYRLPSKSARGSVSEADARAMLEAIIESDAFLASSIQFALVLFGSAQFAGRSARITR